MRVSLKHWVPAALALLAVASVPAIAAPNGLRGDFYAFASDTAMPPDTTAVFVQDNWVTAALTPVINTDFGLAGSRPAGVPNDYWGVRWTGFIVPKYSEDYTFYTASDDGTRLWISDTAIDPDTDTPLVDNWAQQGETEKPADSTISMVAGKKYFIVMDFEQGGGGQVARLRWESASEPKAIVPTEALFPPTSTDTVAPDAVTDLNAGNATSDSITLTFTAPKDTGTGSSGNVIGYDVRSSLVPIDEANFNSATPVVLKAKPSAAGTKESIVVTGLSPLQSYYFAVKARDNGLNTAAISNGAQASTLPAGAVPNLPTLPKVVDKAVYYDNTYSFGWIADAVAQTTRDYFSGQGYKVLSASEMADFMTAHVASKTPSVVVFANDIFPDTVVDISGGSVVDTNLVTDYMSAGGRVLFFGDIPFYNIAQTGGGNLLAEGNGAVTILGVSASGGTWDTNDKSVLSPAGVALGMTSSWTSQRPARPTDVDLVLATSNGGAAAWIKFYPDANGPGFFARLHDTGGTIADAEFADAKIIAELPPAAANPRGRLTGVVKDAAGKPVAGVNVTLAAAGGTPLTVVTDGTGVYSALVAPGDYAITGSGPTAIGVRGAIQVAGTVKVTDGQIANAPSATLAPEPLPTLAKLADADKAVYYDEMYSTGWLPMGAAAQIRDYFSGKGYKVVNAAELATFMSSHITSKTPSVVIASQDILPDTVIDISSGSVTKQNIVVNYLNSGGRLLHYSDIPFYNIARSEGGNLTAADGGSVTILGLSAGGGARDKNDLTVITEIGKALGLTSTWNSVRPALVADVDIVLESAQGGAAGWIRFYPDNTGTGMFIRLVDQGPPGGLFTDEQLADGLKLAELNGTIPVPGGPVQPVVYGDVNGNGRFEITDVVAALQAIAGLKTLTDAQKTAGHVSSTTGSFGITDAVFMLRKLAGILAKFPVEQ